MSKTTDDKSYEGFSSNLTRLRDLGLLIPIARAFLVDVYAEHNRDVKGGLDRFYDRFSRPSLSLKDSSFMEEAKGAITAVHDTQEHFLIAKQSINPKDLYQLLAVSFKGYEGLGEEIVRDAISSRTLSTFKNKIRKSLEQKALASD